MDPTPSIPAWFAREWDRCRFRVRYAGNYHPVGRRLRGRRDHWSYLAIHTGTLAVKGFGQNLTAAAGQVLVLPPHRHAEHSCAGGEVTATEAGFSFLMGEQQINPLTDLGLPVVLNAGATDHRQLCRRLEAGYDHYVALDPAAGLRATHLLGLLLVDCIARGFAEDRFHLAERALVPTWVEVLAHEIASEPTLSPCKIHRHSGFSRSHVIAEFKKYFGMTPRQYFHHCRLELAQGFLANNPEMSVAEVAGQCGYSTHALFNRHFRQLTGKTPGQFRRSHRSA